MRLRTLTGVVATGALALTLTACGSSSGSSGTTTGSATTAPTPVAALTNLTGVKTEVVLDPSFLSALTSLKLTPGVTGTATLTGATLAFPITGGSATYYTPGSIDPYVTGTIMHDGSGISLTAGTGATAKKVTLENFVVDPGKSVLTGDVSLNGASVAKGADLFFLDGRTLQALDTKSSPGNAVLYGTKVSIIPSAAKLLDTTFGTTAVTDYFPVGTARITLKLS